MAKQAAVFLSEHIQSPTLEVCMDEFKKRITQRCREIAIGTGQSFTFLADVLCLIVKQRLSLSGEHRTMLPSCAQRRSRSWSTGNGSLHSQ